MAKKITISYTSNPIIDEGFGYSFILNGLAIPLSGFSVVNVAYDLAGNFPPNGIGLQLNLSDTIDNTVSFLQGQYSHPNLVYARVGDSIEITMNIEGLTATTSIDSNSFTISQSDVFPDEDSNIIYFFEYDNVENVRYSCKISKIGFVGTPTEIQGKATLTKGSVKDHLDTFRGGGLDIELEATESLNLSDLYTEDERTFTVRLFKGNTLLFRGFLKPDGVFQSFVRDRWILNLTCIDGLGALENLSFVKNNGLFFTGKMKAIDIVYNCLNRIGLPMKFNTCINTYYDGLTPSNTLDPLSTIYLSVDRFIKTDDSTIMSCEEVLKSVLDIFCAVITQIDGEWYIYKPNELYATNYPIFRQYSTLGVYTGTKQISIANLLGSQINNFYPHHCNGNQQISIKGAISAFRLGYKYGFIKGILENSSLNHDANFVYDNWTLSALGILKMIKDPLKVSGYEYSSGVANNTGVLITSDTFAVDAGITLQLKVSFKIIGSNTRCRFRVIVGSYYLKQDGSWSTTNSFIEANVIGSVIFELNTLSTPISGSMFVDILEAYNPVFPAKVYISSINIINTFQGAGKVGEFHTVQRQNKPSTLIKANNTVYNGDNDIIVYLGAIFKNDQLTTTSLWSRVGSFEQFPLLRIAAEEELRIQQKPLQIFTGDAYGYIPYLSITNINNVGDKFMPIEWEYDTVKNITKVKFLELYAAEINDIDYTKTFDYGNTVKPTIVG